MIPVIIVLLIIKMEKILNFTYNNPSSPAFMAGASAVYHEARKTLPKLTLRDVKSYLTTQNTYTLHKPIRKRFPRNKVEAAGIDTDWQIDLIDLVPLKKYNRGNAYILTCIDVFSRFAWAEPIMNKKPATVLVAFKKILSSGRKPWRVCHDGGNEFKNVMRQFLKDINIEAFVATSPDVKASNVERYNKTLKTRLWKFFTKEGTFTYLDILPKLVKSINNAVCRVTKMAPANVTAENEEEVRATINKRQPPKPPKFQFKVGDKVRVTKEKTKLGKGYQANFTTEIFTIDKRLNREPATYKLKANDGESISGVWFEPELSPVGEMYKKPRKLGKRRR